MTRVSITPRVPVRVSTDASVPVRVGVNANAAVRVGVKPRPSPVSVQVRARGPQ